MVKAVITGDIIQSTEISGEDKAALFKILKKSLKVWDKDFEAKSELFRGDSFQCLVHDPAKSLELALIIKTFIRSLNPNELVDSGKHEKTIHASWIFDARMAIGIGEVDLEMKDVVTSNGIAFQLSGHQLDQLKNTRMRFSIATDDDFRNELYTEGILLDAIITKTSALQCEVITRKLLGYTETQIARQLKVQQSAINQRSIGANWNAIHAMIERFKTIYAHG